MRALVALGRQDELGAQLAQVERRVVREPLALQARRDCGH